MTHQQCFRKFGFATGYILDWKSIFVTGGGIREANQGRGKSMSTL